jgi:ribosomal protein S18 acetylase RimI-like enzyme
MTAAQFDAWSERSVDGFAAQQVAAGLRARTEARARAESEFAALLPAGLTTPRHHLWQVLAADEVVGWLWLRVQAAPGEVEAYVFDVEIEPRARGRGLGRATMLAAETAARRLGADVIRLNVFAHNHAALRLYDGLQYSTTAATLTKQLLVDPPSAASAPRVTLRTVDAQAYLAWRPRLLQRFSPDELAWLLPHGRLSPGHLLQTAHADGRTVGLVWLHVRERPDGDHAFGYHLEVPEELRSRGYGRAVLAEAERGCRDRGVRSVRLSLSSPSDLATRPLFERAGFEITARSMAKRLAGRHTRSRP